MLLKPLLTSLVLSVAVVIASLTALSPARPVAAIQVADIAPNAYSSEFPKPYTWVDQTTAPKRVHVVKHVKRRKPRIHHRHVAVAVASVAPVVTPTPTPTHTYTPPPTPTPTPSPTPTVTRSVASNLAGAAAAIAFALAQLGKPYIYGGNGPDGFDCSGLTSAAWAAAGVTIPRTSYDQWSQLPHVSTSDLQPGDILVFYGASHVGLYLGGGMMIHAPHTGTVIQKVALAGYYASNMIGAVRP